MAALEPPRLRFAQAPQSLLMAARKFLRFRAVALTLRAGLRSQPLTTSEGNFIPSFLCCCHHLPSSDSNRSTAPMLNADSSANKYVGFQLGCWSTYKLNAA